MELLDKLKTPDMPTEQFKSKIKIPKVKERIRNDRTTKMDVFRPDTLLIVVDGTNLRPVWADKEADAQRLLYEEDGKSQECKILSKPMDIEGTHVYFTRDGFKGTMALSSDTLLDADMYKAPSDLEDVKDDEDLEEAFDGDIAELTGSKATLRTSNKALREKKLLEPQSMAKSKLLMAIGTGVAVGLIISTQLGV